MDSSHNARIMAKREKAIREFMETSGADIHTATHYMKTNAFDLDRAVGAFFDAGSEPVAAPSPAEAAPEPNAEPSPGADDDVLPDDADDVTRIMHDVKKQAAEREDSGGGCGGGGGGSGAFGGAGHSLSSGASAMDEPDPISATVVFYSDG